MSAAEEVRRQQRGADQADYAGMTRDDHLRLARQYAEIQKYQRDQGLEDQGDPPENNEGR